MRRQGIIFPATLFACVAIGLALRLPIALHQFIEYDGWWHVFISRQPLWLPFLSEVGTTAHPPLFFMALRWSQSIFGYSRFAYRFVSLLSGIALIPLVGGVARRLGYSAPAAAVVALVIATSQAATVVSCEVRSYALAQFFTVASFAFLAELLIGTPDRLTIVMLALCNGAAIGSHYFGFLFAAVEIGILLIAMWMPPMRARIFSAITPLAIGTVSVVTLAATALYVIHVRHSMGGINHLPSFYFNPERSESAATFFLRNLHSFVDLFSPIPAGSRTVAGVIAAIVGGSLVTLVFRRPRSAAALSALVTLGVFLVIVAASFDHVYPFGGQLRQQFFIFPFLVLGLVGAIDEAFTGRGAGSALMVLLAIAAITNCVAWRKSFSIESTELFTAEFQKFAASFGTDRTVIVDRFSLVAYFSHAHQEQWRLIRGGSLERFAQFAVGSDVQLLRDRTTWSYDLTERAAFVRLHEVASAAQKREFALFLLRRFPDEPAGRRPDAALITDARLAGLATETLVVDRSAVFGRFKVAESGRGTRPALPQR